MIFSMTGQEKGDLLIEVFGLHRFKLHRHLVEVTAWEGLTVYEKEKKLEVHLSLHYLSLQYSMIIYVNFVSIRFESFSKVSCSHAQNKNKTPYFFYFIRTI